MYPSLDPYIGPLVLRLINHIHVNSKSVSRYRSGNEIILTQWFYLDIFTPLYGSHSQSKFPVCVFSGFLSQIVGKNIPNEREKVASQNPKYRKITNNTTKLWRFLFSICLSALSLTVMVNVHVAASISYKRCSKLCNTNYLMKLCACFPGHIWFVGL